MFDIITTTASAKPLISTAPPSIPAWGERKKTFEALGMPVPIAPIKSKSLPSQHLNNNNNTLPQGLLTSHTTGASGSGQQNHNSHPTHIQKVLIALTPEREEEIKQDKLRKIAKSKEKRENLRLEKKRLKKLSKPFELIDTNLPNDGLVHEVSPFRPRGPAGAGVGSVSVLGDSNAMFPSGVTSSVDVEFPGLHSSRPTTEWDMIGPSGFDADLLKSSTDRDTLGSSGNYKIFGEPVITPIALGSVSQVDTDRMSVSATSASSNGDTTGAEAGSETHSLVNHSSEDLQDSFASGSHIPSGRGSERGRGRGRAGRSSRGEGRGEGRGMSAYNKQFGSRDARNIPRTEGPTTGQSHPHANAHPHAQGHPHNRVDKGDVREGWNGYHGKNDVRGDGLVPLRKAGDPVMSPIGTIGTHSSSSSRRRATEESNNDNRGVGAVCVLCVHVLICACVLL